MNPARYISSEDFFKAITDSLDENIALDKNLKDFTDAKETEFLQKYQLLESQMQVLQEENDRLKRQLEPYERLPQSRESDGTQQVLENFKEAVSSTINEIYAKIGESRAAGEEELSRCTAEYEKCMEMLADLYLTLTVEPYREKLLDYQETQKSSDKIRVSMLVQLKDIERDTNEKLLRHKLISARHKTELKEFLEEHRGKLDALTAEFVSDVKLKEENVYNDTLRVGTQQSELFKSMLLGIRNAKKPNSLHNKRSIVMFNLPNSDQLQNVLDFLNSIDYNISLTEEDVAVTNAFDDQLFGNIQKITLPTVSIVNRIMGNAAERSFHWEGTDVILMTYQKFFIV